MLKSLKIWKKKHFFLDFLKLRPFLYLLKSYLNKVWWNVFHWKFLKIKFFFAFSLNSRLRPFFRLRPFCPPSVHFSGSFSSKVWWNVFYPKNCVFFPGFWLRPFFDSAHFLTTACISFRGILCGNYYNIIISVD